MMDSDTHSRVSSRNGQILPSQPLNSPPPHVFEKSETRCDKSTEFTEFFLHTHVDNAPIGPGNESDKTTKKEDKNEHNEEEDATLRKTRGGGRRKILSEEED